MLHFNGHKDPERRKQAERGVVDLVATVDEQPLTMTFWPRGYRKPITTYAVKMGEEFAVDTLEGPYTGKAGDWLAIGPHGEMYPIDAGVFKDSYELID